MNRRSAIRAGLLGSAVLALGSYVSEPFWERHLRPSENQPGILTGQDQNALRPVIEFFLTDTIQNDRYLRVIQNLDKIISGFPSALQTETIQLLALLQSRLFTGLSGGLWKPLAESEAGEVKALLLAWRNSKITIIQSLYHGLQELVMSAWFADEEVWSEFGYPGPPALFSQNQFIHQGARSCPV